jgi:hypothetical protein
MAGSVINTFDKGLHQDSSFILQPDGTYRNMKNGMLISYDGNHYTVEMPQGNNITLELPSRYLPENDSSGELKDTISSPIGFISFIDKLVVFTTNNESSGGYGEIGVIEFRKDTDLIESYYTPYYHHPSLNFSKLHKIEGFSFKENNSIERIYWTDNNNEPRVFDIANPIFTTYLATGDLVPGTTYMVMGGVIANGGNWYGPSGGTNIPTAPNYVNGNIFEATNANFTIVSGSPLVIEYFPLSLLDWTPTRTMGNINFVEYGTGNKNCGNSIYFYRLSSSLDGVQTSWSYGSNPIHVGMNNETSYLTGVPYHDFVGNGSATTIVNSNKSIKVRVQNIDTDFDTIELCCAEFDQKTEIPYQITIVAKVPISSSDMTIEDGGGTNLGTVTISDLTLFPASILKCKTLSTNKNYNVIGNITEREEFDIDLTEVTLTSFEYPLIAHGDLDNCVNKNVPSDQSPVLGANPGATTIKPWSRYLVSAAPDAANRVEYPVASATYYYTGDVFVGVSGSSTATFTGTAAARPCVTRNRYTKINSSAFSGNRVEDAIELNTGSGFWDFKDPAVASHVKGYWSNEKYRIGILFYDLKGNPYYVRWLSDIDMPDISTKGGLIREDAFGAEKVYSLNNTGINVSGLEIPKSIVEQISGFSIVRAERDARIITQGLVSQIILDQTGSPDIAYPVGPFVGGFNLAGPTLLDKTYSYLCPDLLVSTPLKHPVGNINDKMEEAGWLGAYPFTGNLKVDSDRRAMYAKMFVPLTSDVTPLRTFNIASLNGYGFKTFNENGAEVNFNGLSATFENRSKSNPALKDPGYVDESCSGGAAPVNGFDIINYGCKKYVFKLDSDFLDYGQVYNYSNPSAEPNSNRILVNCLSGIDKANQYGGTSEQAIADTLYMSTGHFQPITSQVIIDNNDTNNVNTYTKLTFNNIEIFGGDCFTNLIDLGYSLWSETYETIANTASIAVFFPCECNSNYNLRRGRKVSNVNMFPASSGDEAMAYDETGTSGSTTVRLESYSYNTGYSTEGLFIKYPALPVNYRFVGDFKYRVRWSGLKFPSELIDSFRTFAIPDYRDVDGQRGQINNLKARDSKLFYWQDHSVGYTPILERQLVGGSALGDATALGVTGVIDRYEDIDTYFGNQHQHGLTETEYGFAWFDMRRRAFMVMGIGGKPEEVSMIKGLQVFFNNTFNEGTATDKSKSIYSTNNINFVEAPLMGYGIVGCYDNRYKMTYITFKYTEIKERFGKSVLNKDFTIGYSHILNAFVSFFDNCPAIWHSHNDLVLSANNPKNTKAYNIDMPSTSYVIEDTILLDNVEYICISPVTISSYPGTLTAGGTNPKAAGVSGSLNDFWRPINNTSTIYLNGIQSSICEFYGKIWPHEIDIIVNAKTNNAVTPQNYQFKGMGPNWTNVEASTDNQTASDMNISVTNRNYRWIDKSWFASLPLPTNGRLTDYYVRIKFTFKNYVSDPTISKNVQKISQWLKTTFVSKR